MHAAFGAAGAARGWRQADLAAATALSPSKGGARAHARALDCRTTISRRRSHTHNTRPYSKQTPLPSPSLLQHHKTDKNSRAIESADAPPIMISRHASRALESSIRTNSSRRRPAAAAAAVPPATAAAAAASRARPALQHRAVAAAASSSSSSSSPPSSSATTTTTTTNPYGWRTDAQAQAEARARLAADPRVREVPVSAIRRPLGKTRKNDPAKVDALVASIAESGLLEPIDVLEVDGVIYGFSGCHRFEAHQRMGSETIPCRVRRATRETLMMHLR